MWTKIETNTYLSLTLTRMKSLLRVLILMNCRVFIVQDLALIDLIDGRARCTCSADWQRVNEWKDAKRCALCKQVFVVTELFNIAAACQRSCGKVMFSKVFVCPRGGGCVVLGVGGYTTTAAVGAYPTGTISCCEWFRCKAIYSR